MAPPPFRFTSYDLESCIELARILQERGGGMGSADELAVFAGYSKAKNGAFLTRLANARLFGLIEGPSSSLRPTQRGLNILQPDYPATADRARLEAFEEVPLYKVVLDQYHGQALPSDEGLKNALQTRWSITADKAGVVLARMMDSAEQAGLFRTTGNRSKMIRPTLQDAGELSPPRDEHSDQEPDGSIAPAGRQQNSDGLRPRSLRDHKLIDGTLDLLPDETNWAEDEMQQWLRLMEMALRVAYRLPEQKGAAQN